MKHQEPATSYISETCEETFHDLLTKLQNDWFYDKNNSPMFYENFNISNIV